MPGHAPVQPPISQFQLIQRMIADSVIEVNAARLLVLPRAYED